MDGYPIWFLVLLATSWLGIINPLHLTLEYRMITCQETDITLGLAADRGYVLRNWMLDTQRDTITLTVMLSRTRTFVLRKTRSSLSANYYQLQLAANLLRLSPNLCLDPL